MAFWANQALKRDKPGGICTIHAGFEDQLAHNGASGASTCMSFCMCLWVLSAAPSSMQREMICVADGYHVYSLLSAVMTCLLWLCA